MQSLIYIAASNGAGNTSLSTIQNVRTPNAVTNIVNTVAGFPTFFYATMGTPRSSVDPVTGETITVITEASAVDFAGTINAGKIDIVEIAPGYNDLGSKVGDIIIVRPITEWANNLFNLLSAAHNNDGTLKNTSLDAFYKPSEVISNFVASGGIIALTTGLTASFSDIVFYISGLRYTRTAVVNRLYTGSKDTYVDITTAGVLVYTEVANNAASPVLAANSIRLARVVTSGVAITSILQSFGDSNGIPIYSRGAISTAQVHTPIKCSAFPSVGVALAINTAQKVVLNVENFDTGSNFDRVTNYRFTAPIAGFYQVDAQVTIGINGIAAGAFALGYVYRNGVEHVRGLQIQGSGNANTVPTSQISKLLFLATGDFLELFAFCSEAGRDIAGGDNRTFLTVYLVSQS